jgi:hypothetical protein
LLQGSVVRRTIVNLIIIGFIAGSAYDIIADQEHWPFSQYPMFSASWSSPTFTWQRVFGVTADGREFPLDANRYVSPFDQSRLPKAFRQMMARKNSGPELRTALRDVMTRYETLRVDGRHEGPPVVGMRLYELEWTIDPQAANVDRPDRKRLVAEVRP